MPESFWESCLECWPEVDPPVIIIWWIRKSMLFEYRHVLMTVKRDILMWIFNMFLSNWRKNTNEAHYPIILKNSCCNIFVKNTNSSIQPFFSELLYAKPHVTIFHAKIILAINVEEKKFIKLKFLRLIDFRAWKAYKARGPSSLNLTNNS